MANVFKSFTENHGEIWKFIKFTFTGASTTVLQMLIDLICRKLLFRSLAGVAVSNAFLNWLNVGNQLDVLLAYFIAATIGYIVSFIMNRKMTFKSDTNAAAASVGYVVMVVATILISTWMKGFFTSIAEKHGLIGELWQQIINIVVIMIPFLWTYPLQRFVIHKPAEQQENPEEADQT